MANEKDHVFRPRPITPDEIDQLAAEAAEELDKLKGYISQEAFKEVKALLDQAEAIPDYNERGTKIFIAWAALQSMRTATERAKDTGEAVDLLISIRPETAIINNSKVANKLRSIAQAGSANVSVDKGAKGNKKVLVEFNTKSATIDGKPLNEISAYDQTVFNAVCTLFEAGNTAFSPDMVYRAMNGLTNSERIIEDRGTLEQIRESISKMATMWISIDDGDVIYASYLLPMKYARKKRPQNGKIIDAYALLEEPALYKYSKQINQVISVNIDLLDTKTIKKNSAKITVVREYLIKRISTMKNQKSSAGSRKIKYSTLFRETGINEDELTQTERNRDRKQIKLLLDDLKQKGYISDYKEYKNGRTFEGVLIDC